MECPDCGSELHQTDERLSESGKLHYVKVFECPNCECEFDEEELNQYKGGKYGYQKI